MAIPFNFSELNNVYLEALLSDDKTLIFETHVGKGSFLFMMFLSDEDNDSKDRLFIYLRNTKYILNVKMYGNHTKGKFEVYITDHVQNKLIEELQLTSNGDPFGFVRFLEQLNNSFPQTIDHNNKVAELRKNKSIISSLNVVDEADKTILIGEVRLPKNKKPQDKTLRKLYMYTDGAVQDIAQLILLLKKFNMTVAWTNVDKQNSTMNVRTLLNKLNQ
ncbi:hypothetical protein D3C75_888130 [compost metagenome]